MVPQYLYSTSCAMPKLPNDGKIHPIYVIVSSEKDDGQTEIRSCFGEIRISRTANETTSAVTQLVSRAPAGS